MSNKIVYTIFIVAFILIVGSIFSIKLLSPPPKAKAYETVYKGKADIGGEFHLKNTNGEVISNDQLHGKYLLVYFGFTYCPDICPTSLHTMSLALEQLSPQILEQIVPIFITIDPKRDTQQHLKKYISNFHPSFIALTGSESEVQQAMKQYKIYSQVRENKENEDLYLIDHSSFIYLMDRKGQYVNHFAHNADPKVIAGLIKAELLK